MLLHKLLAMQILFPFLSPLFLQIYVMKWSHKKIFSDKIYLFLWLWHWFPFYSHTNLCMPNFYKNWNNALSSYSIIFHVCFSKYQHLINLKELFLWLYKNCKKFVKYTHSYRPWSCFTLPTETASQILSYISPNRAIPCQLQTPMILSVSNCNIWFIYPPISTCAHMKKIMACTPWDPRVLQEWLYWYLNEVLQLSDYPRDVTYDTTCYSVRYVSWSVKEQETQWGFNECSWHVLPPWYQVWCFIDM